MIRRTTKKQLDRLSPASRALVAEALDIFGGTVISVTPAQSTQVLLPLAAATIATPLPPSTADFLRDWFSTVPPDQYLEGRAIHPRSRSVVQEWFTPDAINGFCAWARPLVDYDTYFGVCPRIRPQGDKASVTHATGLWCDLDFKRFEDGEAGALQKLADFPLSPTWVVATGGGFHVYWQLRQAVRADAAFEGRLKGVVRALVADPAATDRSRVLRIPGTVNHKYPDCRVRFVSWPTT